MKSVRPIASILLLVATVGFIGCGGSAEKKLIGKWEVDTAALKEAAQAESAGNPGAALAAGMMESMKMTFEFKPEHVLVTNVSMGPMNMSVEGKWEVVKSSGNTATIRIEMENPNTKEVDTDEGLITFVDKDTFEMKPPKNADMPVDKLTLRRVKE